MLDSFQQHGGLLTGISVLSRSKPLTVCPSICRFRCEVRLRFKPGRVFRKGLEGLNLHDPLSCVTEPDQLPALTDAPYSYHRSKTNAPIASHVWQAIPQPNAADEPRFTHQYSKGQRSTPQSDATHYSLFA